MHPESGPEVIVMGGTSGGAFSDTVDIYTINTNSWREGNNVKN